MGLGGWLVYASYCDDGALQLTHDDDASHIVFEIDGVCEFVLFAVTCRACDGVGHG